MRVVAFGGYLGLGGTEKAACRWALGLQERGHDVHVLAITAGPRAEELRQAGIPVSTCAWDISTIAHKIEELKPDVIHMHASGRPFVGDVLGEALLTLPKIPVVQTNVFGRLDNPREDAWTDFRLFISWTSCVQAARRSFRKLDLDFFRRASVAVYPLDPIDAAPPDKITAFRKRNGVASGEILFGRLSRPEPNKWTNLALNAFRLAARHAPKIKLLLREPPPLIAAQLRAAADAGRFVILPATSDSEDLHLTMSALDVVLHTSRIGESFGYGIAEPMNLGKPVITHSVPWEDQAQIELVRHGECGFIASTPGTMAKAIVNLAGDNQLRHQMGRRARENIRTLAEPDASIGRLETVLRAAVERRDNPFAAADLATAQVASNYLDMHQFGHSFLEQVALRPYHYRVRFFEFRKQFTSNHQNF